MKHLLGIVLLFILFTGCRTITVNQEVQQTTQHKVTLLTIGKEKQFVFHEHYKHEGLLLFQKPIKLTVNSVAFNKRAHKAFKEAAKNQKATVAISYIDSIPKKPEFIQLSIADKVSLLDAVNHKQNQNIKDYLRVNDNSGIVTQIAIAFPQETLTKINRAQDVFIAQKGYMAYQLELYKNNELIETLPFENGVVFGYKMNYFCWKENQYHQVEVVSLSGTKQGCPAETYPKAKQAKKKINYFKL